MAFDDIASKMCAKLGHIWSERTPYGRRCLWCGCKEVKWWKALFTKAGRAWLAEKEKKQ